MLVVRRSVVSAFMLTEAAQCRCSSLDTRAAKELLGSQGLGWGPLSAPPAAPSARALPRPALMLEASNTCLLHPPLKRDSRPSYLRELSEVPAPAWQALGLREGNLQKPDPSLSSSEVLQMEGFTSCFGVRAPAEVTMLPSPAG